MNSVLSLLGLAQKAGRIASGEFATEKAIKSGKACLVIVTEDASDNTKNRMRNMTDYYEVPMRIFGQKDEMGRCIGKGERSMLAITDPGFADAAEKKLKDQDTGR